MNNDGAQLPRIETKFVADPASFHRIEEWMRLSPAAFLKPHPPRQVNNVYFDGFDFDSLGSHLSGTNVRSKLRYRWYGTAPGIHAGAIELKCKQDRLQWKRCVPRPSLELTGREAWREIVRRLTRGLSPEVALWLHARPVPVLINSYQRSYFVTADRRVRATVDTDLQVAVQRGASRPEWRPTRPPRGVAVLELKLAPEHLGYATQLTRSLSLRPYPFSKYLDAFR